jgi:predicted nucleotidyltransferase
MNEGEVLALIEQRMRGAFSVRRLVLFGSRATGSARDDSDFDVLVVADSDAPFIERQRSAQSAMGARSFAVDLLVYTPKELESEEQIPGSTVYWALKEGRDFGAG